MLREQTGILRLLRAYGSLESSHDGGAIIAAVRLARPGFTRSRDSIPAIAAARQRM